MTDLKHTPGPWQLKKARTMLHIRGNEDKTPVCSISVSPPRFPEIDLKAKVLAETQANARLIAAAPELLELLEYIAGHADMASCNHGESFMSTLEHRTASLIEISRRTKLAIAKAKGGAA